MSEATPFSLRIFVVDGDPDGLRVVDRTNWNGKALVFPRPLLPKVKQRPEFAQTGVYLLLGPREDGEGEMLYIGEGDPVKDRLDAHYAKKDFWTRAIFFVAGDGQLNKAHVQHLESRLIQLAKETKRMKLENGNTPAEPTLSEADRAYVVVFLRHVLEILPVLGVNAFEVIAKPKNSDAQTALFCKGKGVEAKGYESTKGFVVKAGSEAVMVGAPSLKEHVRGMYDLRADLVESGVLKLNVDKYVFTQDYAFTAPSPAAAVVLGRSSNGRVDWKDSKGQTLKELQESQASSVGG